MKECLVQKSHHVFNIPFEVPTPKEPEKPKSAPKEEPVEGIETETLLLKYSHCL